MGLRQREGHWHYRFEIAGHEWTGNTGLAATERNRKAALRIEVEARQMIEQGKSHQLQIQAVPFIDAVSKFLESCKAKHRDKPNTWKRTAGSMSSLLVRFGRTPVSAITAGDISDYVAWRANHHQVKDVTIRHDLHNLSKFFKYAIKHNWRRDNPVQAEDIPTHAAAVRMHVFTPAEEVTYLNSAHERLRDLVRMMLYQGCRPDELLCLRVEHVNLERMYMTVARSKTNAGERTLRIRPEAAEILARLIQSRLDGWLFPSERNQGKKLSLSTCENWHFKARNTTKIPCVIYDWRHTFATRAANSGMSLATLAKVLGHANLRSVLKYVHPDQKELDRAMEELSFRERQPDQSRTNPQSIRSFH